LKYILIEILIVLLVVMMQIVQRHFYPDCHTKKLWTHARTINKPTKYEYL